MNDFEHIYVEQSAALSVEPLKTILDGIKEAKKGKETTKNTVTLNLSGISIPLKACTALAQALTKDETFTRLILADAFLGDEGCIKLSNGLKNNQKLVYLDIRGNSIRCDGAVVLGQLLKVNSTLQHLNLEWNCVGIWEAGISALADALSMNSTLTTLDLRNNKIGPQGCQSLALSLKHNTTLRRLGISASNK
jgi:Ran GTPase-activating protein (RanGAP) involved in mRNA processing and transport